MIHDSSSATAAIVLAAGGSSRLGYPKQTVLYAGQTLLERTVATALDSPVGALIVVLGANASACRAALKPCPALTALNNNWRAGIGSSIKVGLQALDEMNDKPGSRRFDSALFLTCDQPYLSAQLISDLVARFRAGGAPVVASAYADCLGIPALFSRELFPELLRLSDNCGARALINSYRDTIATVPFPQGEIDIDTETDLAHL